MTLKVNQPKPPSRILEAVHETAADLHGLGLIDSSRKQQYEALCQTPAQRLELAKLRDAIWAGVVRGPGVDAQAAFGRLERKYAQGASISDETGLYPANNKRMLLLNLNLLAKLPAEATRRPVVKSDAFLHNSFSNKKHSFLF